MAFGKDSAPDDALRTEILVACEGLREYGSMPPEVRAAYCACVYDTAMGGLSEDEQQLVRFYLAEQLGLDARAKVALSAPDFGAMSRASAAIGRAVDSCKAKRRRG